MNFEVTLCWFPDGKLNLNTIKYAESYSRYHNSKSKSNRCVKKYHQNEIEALQYMFDAEKAMTTDDKSVMYRKASIAWNKVCQGRKKEMDRRRYDRGHGFRLKLSKQMHRMCLKCSDEINDWDDLFIPRMPIFGSFTMKELISMSF